MILATQLIKKGEIPAKTQMASSMIIVPGHNQDLPVNTTFNITSKLNNLDAGFFSSAAVTYYSAPTQLNAQGVPKGHTHVSVQVYLLKCHD
jgi:transcription initiation factor TFIID subunit 15